MTNNSGQFKRGQHWREPKLYWDREWLYQEYIVEQKSASEIAVDFDCSEGNILAFLHKLEIPTRTISAARKVKHWGSCGPSNPMYGKTGSQNPNWKGGVSPERQRFYSSREWATAVHTVWQRDKATCQRCHNKPKTRKAGRAFHIHHIVAFENKRLRCVVSNLVLLCQGCHEWVHSRKNCEGKYINE